MLANLTQNFRAQLLEGRSALTRREFQWRFRCWLKLPSLLNQEYLDDIKKDIVPLCSYDRKMSPNTFNDGLWEWKAIFLKSSDIYMKQPHPSMKCHLFHIQYLLKKEEC